MGHPELLHQLAETFLSAPFEENGWETALGALAKATHSTHGELIAVGDESLITLNLTTDMDPRFEQDFVAINGGSAALNWRIACLAPPLEVRHETHYAAARKRLQSTVYDDFARQYDAFNGCQTVLSLRDDHFVGMAILRSDADGVTTEADRQVFAHGARTALSALRIQRAIANQGAALVLGALESPNTRTILLDSHGLVAGLTDSAERWFSRGTALRLRNGHLSAKLPSENDMLQRVLRQALLAPPTAPVSARLWIRNGIQPHEGVAIEVFTLPTLEWNLGFGPRVMVAVHPGEALSAERAPVLEAALRLSPAEAAVAMLLAQGKSREMIAGERHASPQTVNAQIRNIFRKADVNREAELVSLINNLLR